MSGKLTRSGYEQLIEGDLAAMEKAKSFFRGTRLEWEHIVEVLKASPEREYGKEKSMAIKGGPGHSRRSIDPGAAVIYLNELLGLDQEAISKLVRRRGVQCNDDLAKHQTAQATKWEDGSSMIGLLGIINGLFGVDEKGRGLIGAEYNERIDLVERFYLRGDKG